MMSGSKLHLGIAVGAFLALPERVFASEVWVRVDGKWLQKFYQETIIEEE